MDIISSPQKVQSGKSIVAWRSRLSMKWAMALPRLFFTTYFLATKKANNALVWAETIRVVNEWFNELDARQRRHPADLTIDVVPDMVQVYHSHSCLVSH